MNLIHALSFFMDKNLGLFSLWPLSSNFTEGLIADLPTRWPWKSMDLWEQEAATEGSSPDHPCGIHGHISQSGRTHPLSWEQGRGKGGRWKRRRERRHGEEWGTLFGSGVMGSGSSAAHGMTSFLSAWIFHFTFLFSFSKKNMENSWKDYGNWGAWRKMKCWRPIEWQSSLPLVLWYLRHEHVQHLSCLKSQSKAQLEQPPSSMWQTRHWIARFYCRECLEWCSVKWQQNSSEQPNAETILSPRQMRWLAMVATSTTWFVLQLFLSTAISDPEPAHKPFKNSAALFPQPNPGPSKPSLSTGCWGTAIDPKCLFKATSSRTRTVLNVLSGTSLVTIDIPWTINCQQILGNDLQDMAEPFQLHKEHSELSTCAGATEAQVGRDQVRLCLKPRAAKFRWNVQFFWESCSWKCGYETVQPIHTAAALGPTECSLSPPFCSHIIFLSWFSWTNKLRWISLLD